MRALGNGVKSVRNFHCTATVSDYFIGILFSFVCRILSHSRPFVITNRDILRPEILGTKQRVRTWVNRKQNKHKINPRMRVYRVR